MQRTGALQHVYSPNYPYKQCCQCYALLYSTIIVQKNTTTIDAKTQLTIDTINTKFPRVRMETSIFHTSVRLNGSKHNDIGTVGKRCTSPLFYQEAESQGPISGEKIRDLGTKLFPHKVARIYIYNIYNYIYIYFNTKNK